MCRSSRSVASDAKLSGEWCKEGNGDELLKTVALGSKKKRVWRCLRDPKHPAYFASPHKRSASGTGCPQCAKEDRRIQVRRRTIVEEFPQLAAQWDHTVNDRTPETVTSGSKYMASWICLEPTCQHLHCWRAPVYSRAASNSGCPFCSGLLCCPCNSLAGKYPELLAEWDSTRIAAEGRDPNQVSAGSSKLVWWKSAERGSWQQTPNKRVLTLERTKRKVRYGQNAGWVHLPQTGKHLARFVHNRNSLAA